MIEFHRFEDINLHRYLIFEWRCITEPVIY